MFNLIYLILGIYLVKLIVTRSNMYYKNRKNNMANTDNKSRVDIISKLKEKNTIFVFNNHKEEESSNETVNNLHNDEIWKVKRQEAFEKAKYKCEECGNIANLEIYSKNSNDLSDDLMVLCKSCYKEYVIKADLNYE